MNVVERAILPIFSGRDEGDGWRPRRIHGTGLLIASLTGTRQIFVTCWHCLSPQLEAGESYSVAFQNDEGSYALRHLDSITQDPSGQDLATATLQELPMSFLHLAERPTETADSVHTFGYPLTEVALDRHDNLRFTLHSRILKGYVTQAFTHERPGWGPTPSYELDMLTPAGLSGAPLIDAPTGAVSGVVYGGWDVATILHMARIDPSTGEVSPEVQRMTGFGLAHYYDTLAGTSGAATDGLPLVDFLRQ